MCEECKNKAISGELLSEDKLTEVVGGVPTQNRRDPYLCGSLTRPVRQGALRLQNKQRVRQAVVKTAEKMKLFERNDEKWNR